MSGTPAGISVGIVDEGENQTFVAITISGKGKLRQLLLRPDRAVALMDQLEMVLGGLGMFDEDDELDGGEVETCLLQ